jgi:hypothetical protein
VKNISLIFTQYNQELQQYIVSKLFANNNINATIFADKSLNLSSQAIAILPKADLLSFTGDVICVAPEDVELVRTVKRPIQIKFIMHERIREMQNWFAHESDIEYLIGLDDSMRPETSPSFQKLAESLVGIKNLRTLSEYLS